ncbi:hypothetical protein STEG23_000839, partial [Scotinomys teguina]
NLCIIFFTLAVSNDSPSCNVYLLRSQLLKPMEWKETAATDLTQLTLPRNDMGKETDSLA